LLGLTAERGGVNFAGEGSPLRTQMLEASASSGRGSTRHLLKRATRFLSRGRVARLSANYPEEI
jgi:hypothetical protein